MGQAFPDLLKRGVIGLMFDDFLSEFITKKKIGAILVSKGLITDEQVEECLNLQQGTREYVGQIFVRKNYVTQEQLFESLAEQFGMQYADMDEIKSCISKLDAEAQDILSVDYAVQHEVCLYKVDPEEGTLFVLTCDPADMDIGDMLQKLTGHEVQMVVTTRENLVKALALFKNLGLKLMRQYYMAALNGGGEEVAEFVNRADHPKYLPLLLQLLENHAHPLCRQAAAKAIAHINSQDKTVVQTLGRLSKSEVDPAAKTAIDEALKLAEGKGGKAAKSSGSA